MKKQSSSILSYASLLIVSVFTMMSPNLIANEVTYDASLQLQDSGLPPAAEQKFYLTEANMDPGHLVLPQKPVGGTIVIGANVVTLHIDMEMLCKPSPDVNCIQVMPEPLDITLPIISSERAECGDVILAAKDSRPVDGLLGRIKITDYRNSRCKYFFNSPIHLEYVTSGYDRSEHSQFTYTSNFEFSGRPEDLLSR